MFDWFQFYSYLRYAFGEEYANILFDIHFEFWISCGTASCQKYDAFVNSLNLRLWDK